MQKYYILTLNNDTKYKNMLQFYNLIVYKDISMGTMIGRKDELKILQEACDSPESNLIAIYGRRRIGKTYLVNHMFEQHKDSCIFFRFTGAYNQDNDIQLGNFINAVKEWFGIEPTQEIKKWAHAFDYLKVAIQLKQALGQKAVVFLDEVPWVDPTDSYGFLGALGYFWNEFAENNKNIICILCASNSAWIKNKIFEDSIGPLFQRLNKKIPLKPFTLQETKEYLLGEKHFRIDDKTIVEFYMIFGGVAKYLSYLDPRQSIAQNVDALIFDINGHLNKEYSDIFTSLFGANAEYYTKIIDALSKNQSGLIKAEILKELKETNNSKLIKALDVLMETGFIMSLSKFGSPKINEKYFLCDPFVSFFNKWVKPLTKNEIMSLQKPYFNTIQSSQQYAIMAGYAFEKVCLTNIEAYLCARSTKGLAKSYGYWAAKASELEDTGAQIDILVEYQNDVYDIVECKFYNSEFEITKKYKEDVLNKIEQFKKHISSTKKYDIKLVFLTSYGCKKNQHYNALNISADLTIEDLFKF